MTKMLRFTIGLLQGKFSDLEYLQKRNKIKVIEYI